MSKKSKKKQMKCLTLQEKLEVIEYKENNTLSPDTDIANLFSNKFKKSINRRSIKNYMDNKASIKEATATNGGSCNVSRPKKYDLLDVQLKQWFDIVENQGAFITEAILRAKALALYKELYLVIEDDQKECSDFHASNGWLYKFKQRHGISLKQCSGESFNPNQESYSDFIAEFNIKILFYGAENVFNCDETALFYKLSPSKSLLARVRKGVKQYKDRVTVLLACNRSGSEKLKPLILGKSKNPRCFKNFQKASFCDYYNNDNAWMTSKIFNQWLIDWDSQLRRNNRKILLLLDNCPAHKISCQLTNIELLFLPKNSTSRLQPLDAGIIRSFKAKFFNLQLSAIVSKVSAEVNILGLYKEVSLKDAVIYTKYAWNDVSTNTIINCWEKALPSQCKNPASTDASDDKIAVFEEIQQHIISEDVINESEFLDFCQYPVDITHEFFVDASKEEAEKTYPEDGKIAKMRFDVIEEENETPLISPETALFYFSQLKNFVLKDELQPKIYDALKDLEIHLNTESRKRKFKTIDDYINKK
ncbi:Tigger transposable element-derived protein 6 [Dictyocoela muelleri]|nr:Tigger transposable element-derived protein 6 [Dictyocoela muelleri]